MQEQENNRKDLAERLTRQFMKHQQLLLAYISTIVLDYHKAEDVLQETAVVLMRRAQEYGGTENFWPLAREIARRQAIAMLQKDAKSPRLLPDDIVMTAIEAGFETVPQDDIRYGRTLLRCIEKLPELWRSMIKMRYWMQHSIKHIAQDLDRSDNTVSVTLSRARSRLADCVLRHADPGEMI